MSIAHLTTTDRTLFEHPEERVLMDALMNLKVQTAADLASKKYTRVLQKTAALKKPIDAFFYHVMVMIEDAKLRHNRLCLLAQLSEFLNQVADMSCL